MIYSVFSHTNIKNQISCTHLIGQPTICTFETFIGGGDGGVQLLTGLFFVNGLDNKVCWLCINLVSMMNPQDNKRRRRIKTIVRRRKKPRGMGSRRVGLKRERGLERRRKGRVKVHNDGRMSAQQEITVEGLLSAQGPFHPLLSFSLHMKTKKIKLARGSVSKNS